MAPPPPSGQLASRNGPLRVRISTPVYTNDSALTGDALAVILGMNGGRRRVFVEKAIKADKYTNCVSYIEKDKGPSRIPKLTDLYTKCDHCDSRGRQCVVLDKDDQEGKYALIIAPTQAEIDTQQACDAKHGD